MVKRQTEGLTGLGQLINEAGLALPFIIEKSGINRNRLVYLRTNPNAVLSLGEAQVLAPLFRMTLDEFAVKLAELQPQGKSGEK